MYIEVNADECYPFYYISETNETKSDNFNQVYEVDDALYKAWEEADAKARELKCKLLEQYED